jgi:ferredoxin
MMKDEPTEDTEIESPLVADEDPAVVPPPAHRVRGEGLLVAAERWVARFDAWLGRWLPDVGNPFLQTGRAANFALLVAVASGILMLIWYSPSVHTAHASLASLSGRSLGGWVRTLHRYSSDLVMLLMALHAARMVVARKFTGPRWLAWVTGVGLLALVWFIGWTGFWLVWDGPAREIAVASMGFLDTFPIFGEPLGRQFVADRLVPSLLFFVVFFLHMLLPLGIAVGLFLHLSRLKSTRLLPDRRLSLAMVAGLALAALAVPAPLDPPAAMAEKPEAFTVDAWYLAPLALTLRMQSAGLWVGIGLTALLAGVPWLLGRRLAKVPDQRDVVPLRAWQSVVRESRCHACTQCVQDCPFEAITMVPRSDGKRFATRARVDPDRCVGCGVCIGSCDSDAMSLVWFDVHREEAAIRERLKQSESPSWLALVSMDLDGGARYIREQEWRREFPGYHVEFVPTSAWVRPKFVERVLRDGAAGVFMLRDVRSESTARLGNQWVKDRFTGERSPAFKPGRAGAGNWRIFDWPSPDSAALRTAATAFRENSPSAPAGGTGPVRWRVALGGIAVALLLAAATIAPSHLKVTNPVSSSPELVFSFRVLGEMENPAEVNEEAQKDLPVHMRGRSTVKPHRAAVTVTLTIDGRTETRSYAARGISRDGPAVEEWRVPLETGERRIRIEVNRGRNTPPLVWEGSINALPRRYHVLTYNPADGFFLE